MKICSKIFTTTFLVAVLITLCISCSPDHGSSVRTTIRGDFPGFGGGKVSLSEIEISKTIPVDTININKNGSFKFVFRRTGPGFYLVKVDNRNYVTLILDEEKNVTIIAPGKDIRRSYTVEGSKDSELYRQFELFLDANRQKVDSLRRTYTQYQNSPGFQSINLQLDKDYQGYYDQQRQYTLNFLSKHGESLASLLVINRRFGERQIISPDRDLDLYLHIDSLLTARYPDNKHLQEHKKRIEEAKNKMKIGELMDKKLAPGKPAPDIELENPDGKVIPLHSLSGRPVIVCFWASWDEASREPLRMLKESLGKIQGKKPVVYAVGFESYRELWKNAIEKDGTGEWVHVTDYLNIYSSVKSLYNVPDELPFYYLLNSRMIIQFRGNDLNGLMSALSTVN